MNYGIVPEVTQTTLDSFHKIILFENHPKEQSGFEPDQLRLVRIRDKIPTLSRSYYPEYGDQSVLSALVCYTTVLPGKTAVTAK